MIPVTLSPLGINTTLQKCIGMGGQSKIYESDDDPTILCKIYEDPTPADEERITTLIEFQKTLDLPIQGEVEFAWPLGVIHSQEEPKRFLGYYMQNFTNCRSLKSLFRPGKSEKYRDYGLYLKIAERLAYAVELMHNHSIIISDFHPGNVLIRRNATLVFVDCDSFQFCVGSKIYRSGYGCELYTPPELIGRNFNDVDRRPEHDRFALAITLFQLLMLGNHPYQGEYVGKKGKQIDPVKRIAKNLTPYFKPNLKSYKVRELSPTLDLLSPKIQSLFKRCLLKGFKHPDLRPSASQWRKAFRKCGQQDEKYLRWAQKRFQFYIRKIDAVAQPRIRCPPWVPLQSIKERIKDHPWISGCLITLVLLVVLALSGVPQAVNRRVFNTHSRNRGPFKPKESQSRGKPTTELWRSLSEE